MEKGIFNVSLNGEDVRRLPINSTHKFKSSLKHFNISVGELVTHMSLSIDIHPQYDGLVSNINVFEYDPTLNLAEMSANLCNYNNGTYISWEEMDFNLFGKTKLGAIPANKICHEKETESTNLFLPHDLTIFNANFTCHKLYGHMTEYR